MPIKVEKYIAAIRLVPPEHRNEMASILMEIADQRDELLAACEAALAELRNIQGSRLGSVGSMHNVYAPGALIRDRIDRKAQVLTAAIAKAKGVQDGE